MKSIISTLAVIGFMASSSAFADAHKTTTTPAAKPTTPAAATTATTPAATTTTTTTTTTGTTATTTTTPADSKATAEAWKAECKKENPKMMGKDLEKCMNDKKNKTM